MPKAAPRSRVSARLNTPGAESVGEDGLLGGQTEGEAALEAVGELDSTDQSFWRSYTMIWLETVARIIEEKD